ncbi:MAG: DUF1993 domain-containing protein [Pseudomonadota bacterium]
MSNSLYDHSVAAYKQGLDGVLLVLDKAADHYRQQEQDIEALVRFRLHEDMLPFSFQLHSVLHHSLGAIRGLQTGVFTPPPDMPERSFAGWRQSVSDTAESLASLSREEVDGLAGGELVFRLSAGEFPFTAERFVSSFSLPNFYFHVTTAYDMARMQGVPLSKLDYLGGMGLG